MSPAEPNAEYAVVVVGGGPAGLAAAASAAEGGTRVALVDSGVDVGGQYWRGARSAERAHLHHGRDRFRALLRRVEAAGVVVLSQHHVQAIARDGESWHLQCARGSEPRADGDLTSVRGSRLVLTTGAYDRQLPFSGWDLPGVMTAGGVQALLKGHGVLAGRRVVVAGAGPFLLSVADGLLRSGATVVAVLESSSPLGFARHPAAVATAGGKLVEAAAYVRSLALSRVPYRRRHAVQRAVGGDRVEAVDSVRVDREGRLVPGSAQRLPCDLLAVGWGFTPQLELHLQVGCTTELGADGNLVVTVDRQQGTSVDQVWAAGESTGVGGADLAAVEGEIAGRAAVGVPIPGVFVRRRDALRRFASAMHAVHPVPAFLREPPGETTLCRCEEISVEAVRESVVWWGASDARSAKMFTRVGMGWCQGRTCGYAAAEIVAQSCGRAVAISDLRAFAERPFTVPLPLRVIAEDDSTE